MVDIMRKHARAYDLIVAGDVLVYVGDLTPTFEAAAASLRPGGHFIFSIEVGAIERFKMDVKTRRFVHADGYVRRLPTYLALPLCRSTRSRSAWNPTSPCRAH